MTATEEFTEFATGAAPRLRRTAFLLCRNWHTAEDLTQATLVKMFVSWRRISRQDAVYAYANRTLVNTYLADRRGKRARELLMGWLPERPVELPTPELRIVVLQALATLPPKARVVVVMRYWADLSVDQVADLLRCSPGNVKSQSAAGWPSSGCYSVNPGGLSRPRTGWLSSQLTTGARRGVPGMNEPMMEEAALREMLERATAVEPPIGPVARNAVRAGVKRRRRRRVAGAAAVLAVAAAVFLTIPAVTGIRSTPAPATGTIPATVWVANYRGQGSVTPISTTTNQAGTPIVLGSALDTASLAATPNGKTVYAVMFGTNRVIPISTATNTAGKPIKVGKEPDAIAITPDGRTAYVAGLASGTVTPIATATNTPGPAIKVGRANAGLVAIAITPDGRTAYVVNDGTTPDTVVPISTATDQAGKPISVGLSPRSIAITPDGKTAYVVCAGTVTPIDVATNKAGPPIKIGGTPGSIVFTPDSKTAYINSLATDTVTPISVATNTAGIPIRTGRTGFGIAITPDGKTVFVANLNDTVTPISTATNTTGTPIRACANSAQIAITPDGKAAYVMCSSSVTPIATATGKAGAPIKVPPIPWMLVIVPDPAHS